MHCDEVVSSFGICLFVHLIRFNNSLHYNAYIFVFNFNYFRKGFTEEATFVISKRGYSKLTLNGYEYTKRSTNNGITYWRCCNARWKQCGGKAQTQLIDKKQMVKAYDDHNHPKADKN